MLSNIAIYILAFIATKNLKFTSLGVVSRLIKDLEILPDKPSIINLVLTTYN
jgi:hypothetical protein